MRLLTFLLLFISYTVCAQREFQKIVGRWEAIQGTDTLLFHFEEDGIITMSNKSVNQVIGGRENIRNGKKVRMVYALDISHEPLWLDMIISEIETRVEQKRLLGIFEFINDNEIQLDLSRDNERPTAFSERAVRLVRMETPEVPGDFPEASTTLLKAEDLAYMDDQQLMIMRNEIFARYGYIFKKEELKEHFSEQSWYTPQFTDVTNKLTEIEKSNIKLITAREAWLRPIAIKKLPRLTLPCNLENGFATEFQNVMRISPSAGGHSPVAFVGILPDTSKYYAVLWYTHEAVIVPEKPPRVYHITTYTKNFTEIATATVSLLTGGYFELSTDCAKKGVTHSAMISRELAYASTYSYDETCPGEKTERRAYEISGQIKSDGKILVITNKGY